MELKDIHHIIVYARMKLWRAKTIIVLQRTGQAMYV